MTDLCTAFIGRRESVLVEFTDETRTHQLKQFVVATVPHNCSLDIDHKGTHLCICGTTWETQ